MTPEFLGPTGSEESRSALQELLQAGRRSVEAYRGAEEVVRDHRVEAALGRLRLDHERHVRELTELLAELGGEVIAADGAADAGPVGEAVRRGDVSGAAMLDAVREAESELHAAYERHAERGYVEPIHAILTRHRREEEAHEAWVRESGLWKHVRAEVEPVTVSAGTPPANPDSGDPIGRTSPVWSVDPRRRREEEAV